MFMVAGKTKNGENGLSNKQYMKELRQLQSDLCRLHDWVKYKGLRVMVVFEGRDAAGKGGTIRAITEPVSARVFLITEDCDRLIASSTLLLLEYLASYWHN